MISPSVDVERVAAALEVMIAKVDRRQPFAIAVDAAPIGRRQLERSFRRLGTSPNRELCRIRLELAVGELTSKSAASSRLSGIARRVGHADERRLREATHDGLGLSPGEIRLGARISRNLKLDEAARSRFRGKKFKVGVWRTVYRRRQNREKLQRLLRKANPHGANVIVGQVLLPRPAEARERAAELAKERALSLYVASRGELREVA